MIWCGSWGPPRLEGRARLAEQTHLRSMPRAHLSDRRFPGSFAGNRRRPLRRRSGLYAFNLDRARVVEFVGSLSSYENVSAASAEPADWPKLPQHVSAQVDRFPESSYGATTVTLVLSNGRRIERVVIGGHHIVRIGDRDITHADQLGFDVSRSPLRKDRIRSSVSSRRTSAGCFAEIEQHEEHG